MSTNGVTSIGVISLDFDVFKNFPLSTTTWKVPMGKEWIVLGFQRSFWWANGYQNIRHLIELGIIFPMSYPNFHLTKGWECYTSQGSYINGINCTNLNAL